MIIGDFAAGRAFTPATVDDSSYPLLLMMGIPTIALVMDLPYPAITALYALTGTGSAYLLGLQRRFPETVLSDLQ